jgi:hypothetical protein
MVSIGVDIFQKAPHIASDDIVGDGLRSRLISPRPQERTMLRVKPGQIWDHYSRPGAVGRQVEVINVLGDQVELRFLDMTRATDLERSFTTSGLHMLIGSRAPSRYRGFQKLPKA